MFSIDIALCRFCADFVDLANLTWCGTIPCVGTGDCPMHARIELAQPLALAGRAPLLLCSFGMAPKTRKSGKHPVGSRTRAKGYAAPQGWSDPVQVRLEPS